MSRPTFARNEPDIIDKESFLRPPAQTMSAGAEENDTTDIREDLASDRESNWVVTDECLRYVPPYYPMEKSCRVVRGTPSSTIAARISDCCKVMSVQAKYDNNKGTAFLHTAEHVEIYLSLWHGAAPLYDPESVIVEAQRRKGCVVTFHSYCRKILDAAQGEFNSDGFAATDGGEKGGIDRNNSPYIMKAPALKKKADGEDDIMDKALVALNIAASLIKKDRMDARRLGMESLCLLTDPLRAGIETAKISSRVVLLGTAQEELATGDAILFDESADLGIRETILSLVLKNESEDDGGYDSDASEEKEYTDVLQNLALAVLSNALNVFENSSGEEHVSPSRSNSDSSVPNTFLRDTQDVFGGDILSTLLGVLGQAENNPHDAYLSAKCLGSLFKGSDESRRRAKDLNAKQVVCAALEVGQRTHTKLAEASQKVIRTLAIEEEDS